jgi:hypothetical protein
MFRSNTLPPCSGSKSMSHKQPAIRMLLASYCSLGLLFKLEDGSCTFLQDVGEHLAIHMVSHLGGQYFHSHCYENLKSKSGTRPVKCRASVPTFGPWDFVFCKTELPYLRKPSEGLECLFSCPIHVRRQHMNQHIVCPLSPFPFFPASKIGS